jgi:hypothetical protein
VIRVTIAAVVVATGVLAGAVDSAQAPAAALGGCAKGSTAAVIGGRHVCLRAGQRCQKRLDKQYHRYKFHCHTGRLTRAQKPVPLTPVTVSLQSVGALGVSGTATLTPVDAITTRVVLDIKNSPAGAGPLPAHIHLGSCANTGGVYEGLDSVVDGHSTSEVGAIAPLRRGEFSINVHDPRDPDWPVVACGDIPRV